MGALLFGAASLSAVPSGLLLEPVPGFELIVVLALGLASAAACWFIPWERLSTWSLDVVCVVGNLEVLLVCHIIDETYRVLYTLPWYSRPSPCRPGGASSSRWCSSCSPSRSRSCTHPASRTPPGSRSSSRPYS